MHGNISPKTDAQLAEYLGSFYADPLGFVMAAYPWGEPYLPDGSKNPLANKQGPEPWQRRLLIRLGAHVRENVELVALGLFPNVWRSAIASGHGVGKSAMVAWLEHWLMATRPDTRGAVTANTQKQLEDKTWPELAKWHNLFIAKHWFKWEATAYKFAAYPEDRQKNYMLTAATVSETNTEAFAGLHNEGKTVVVIFDEASGIHAKIWEVAQGALTDGEAFFFIFGNPTRPDGEFADCFTTHRAMYYLDNVDARDVSHTNKQHIADIIKLWDGEDSDAVKVRIRGIFPTQAFNGFISMDTYNTAVQRELWSDAGAARIMAIDVARYGDDETVFGFRQGRDARTIRQLVVKHRNNVQVAQIAMELAGIHKPDCIVIESTGPSTGVIDILRSRGYRVHEVHPGAPSANPDLYFNVRAELWCKMRDWLVLEGCINEEPVLAKQLTSILYTLDRKEQSIRMESKKDYKERTLLSSPDRADTLMLTFGVSLPRRDDPLNTRVTNMPAPEAVHEYDEMEY